MYRVVKIDETHAYIDEGLVERSGGKIYSVYIYNDQEQTHLCEITPSYWLEEVDVVPEVYPDYDLDQGVTSDRLSMDLMESRNEDGGIYVHCHQVDRLPSDELGDFEDMDEAREHYSGNPLY